MAVPATFYLFAFYLFPLCEARVYYFIEPMVEADIEQVQQIERRSFTTLWSANTYRTELRNVNTSRYIVARASPTPPPPRDEPPRRRPSLVSGVLSVIFGGAPQITPSPFPIVGYGGLWLSIDEAHVTTIAVAPEYRSHGIGELLLNGLVDQAMAMNADLLTLEVRISNITAQQLYLKYGFKPISTRPRYYTDNSEDALIMSTEPIHTPVYQEKLHRLREHLFNRLRQEAGEPAPLDTANGTAPGVPPQTASGPTKTH